MHSLVFQQGKVAFAESNSSAKGPRGWQQSKDDNNNSARVRLSLGADPANDENAENEEQERLPTRGGSRLPPLRTPTMPLSRVYTPANFPLWGLCVTASQRSMLVDGLERDRAFLSRQRSKIWRGVGKGGLGGGGGARREGMYRACFVSVCSVSCFTSQQQASVSQGRICLDNIKYCYT